MTRFQQTFLATRTAKLRLASVVLGVLLIVLQPSSRPAPVDAAGPPPPSVPPVISNINVIAINANSATVTWTTDYVSSSVVNFGLTSAYDQIATGSIINVTQHAVTLAPLEADKTYHFQVESQRGVLGAIARSVDRTFRTPASSADLSLPTLVNINVDAIDKSAIVTFGTTKPAAVELRWSDTASSLIHGITVPLNTTFTVRIPPVGDPDLTPNTIYYFQITATDNFGNVYTSGEFNFRTSGSANDHTFTTGGCFDPGPPPTTTEIGDCKGLLFCDGGTFRNDCTKCGFACAGDETCAANGVCVRDPALTSSAYQCNKDECYNGQAFKRPAPAGCWKTWPRCSANIVLKVQRDRVCDQWITCAVSQQQTLADTGTKADICVGLGACSSVGPGGTCNSVLGQGQCSNDPLKFCNTNADCGTGNSCISVQFSSQNPLPVTYRSPQDVSKIKNLTGNIKAGLDWGTSKGVIVGQYPWFLAQQLGDPQSDFNLKGDFEAPARSLGQRYNSFNTGDWSFHRDSPLEQSEKPIQIALEDAENLATGQENLNHVLKLTPKRVDDNFYVEGPSQGFTALQNLDYFIKLRLRTQAAGGRQALRIQLVDQSPVTPQNPDGPFHTLAELSTITGDSRLNSSWQEFSFGPVSNLTGETHLRLYFVAEVLGGTTDAVFLDDVAISPVLEVRPSQYIFPSCRLFPNESAVACNYQDQSGASLKGQSGYCLERDPKNPAICISWWPVDAIRGEENAFGTEKTAGFNVASPVYFCLQNRLYTQPPTAFWASEMYDRDPASPNYGNPVTAHGSICIDASGQGCDRSECRNNARKGRWHDPNMCPPGYHRVLETDGYWDNGYRCGASCERNNKRNGCEYLCLLNAAGDPIADRIRGTFYEYTGVVQQGSAFANRCAVIAKVADAGQNAAWAARVQQGSPYLVGQAFGQQFSVPPTPQYLNTPTDPTKTLYPVSQATGYTLDYPFGRLVSPKNQPNPEDWQSIQIRSTCEETTGDLLQCKNGKSPGEFTGAVPYAWASASPPGVGADCVATRRDNACSSPSTGNGTCTLSTGRCSNSGAACSSSNGCRAGGDNLACTFAVGVTGQCSGTGASCILNKVCQNFPATECNTATQAGQPDNKCASCENNAAISCTNVGGQDAACGVKAPGPPVVFFNCAVPANGICMMQDFQCNAAVSCVTRAPGFKQCSNDLFVSTSGRGYCSDVNDGLPADPAARTECSVNNDCTRTVQFCREVQVGDGDRTVGYCANAATGAIPDRQRTCTTDSDCSRCILPSRCSVSEDCYDASCEPPGGVQGACPNGTVCSVPEDCYNDGLVDPHTCESTGTCSSGGRSGLSCNNDGDCVTQACQDVGAQDTGDATPPPAPTVAKCVSVNEAVYVEPLGRGVERLKRIFASQYGIWYWDNRLNPQRYTNCSGGTCGSFAFRNPSPYTDDPNFASSWHVPTTRCAGPRDPLAVGDFCGIPPEVFSAQWRGGEVSITIKRGERATLLFNTRADAEQKPLRRIFIDWKGDGTLSGVQSYAFPYDAKDNLSDPHVFTYQRYDNPGTTPVIYTPRVLVEDNWGWCNNGDNSPPCDHAVPRWKPIGVSITVE